MIPVLFQDEHILVLDKPPYLVVEPAETTQKDTLVDILQKDFGISLFRGGLVHRLDKDTSGVLVVAKTQAALENLQAQFKERKTKKEYIALVHGVVEKGGVVDAAIVRNPGDREKFIVSLQGDAFWSSRPRSEAREAVTEYEPMQRLQFTEGRLQEIFSGFNEQSSRAGFHQLNKIQMRKLSTTHYNLFTLLRCFPKTGRTHQIRVHLKYIGHPIVADEKYCGRKSYRLDKRWCSRQFLHAAKLGFYHPESGGWMEVESPLAADLKEVLKLISNG